MDKKIINNIPTNVFSISHTNCVYYNYSNKITLTDKLNEMDAEIASKSGGSGTGLRPQVMKTMIGTYDTILGKYKLKFEEPADTIIEGQTLCTVEKVVIVRKKDSDFIHVYKYFTFI